MYQVLSWIGKIAILFVSIKQETKKKKKKKKKSLIWCYDCLTLVFCFVLGFYGPVNPMGSCLARSVYLTTRLLGRLSPLSG